MTDLMDTPAHEPDPEQEARRTEARSILEDLEQYPGEFYPSADGFICDMCDQRDRHMDSWVVTEPQLDYLRKLHEKYC